MKRKLLSLAFITGCLLFSVGIYLISSFGLEKFFLINNITAQTAALAPSWAAWMYVNAEGLKNLSFLLPAGILMNLSRKTAPPKATKLHLLFAPAGIISASILLSILLVSGSIRLTAVRVYYSPAAALGYAFQVVLEAAVVSGLLRKKTAALSSVRLRYAISVLGQAALTLIARRCIVITHLLNAALLGWLTQRLFEKTKSTLPEILFLSMFRFTQAVLFGYPDLGGAYAVSEIWLTGAELGLGGAGITLIFLSALPAAQILYFHIRKAGKDSEPCRKKTCFSLPIFRQDKKS